jgi:hypothetical protein
MLCFLRRGTCGDDQKVTIYGPKADGIYIVEFKTAEGEALAISIPRTEAAVIRHFWSKMPYGLAVPDAKPDTDRCGCYPSVALPAGGIR